MPPAAIGVGLAVGAIGSVVGSAISSNAQQNIAQAQLDASQNNRNTAIGYAQPTAAELATQSQQMQYQSAMISRQETMLSAVDPALMESGKQALQLLQGKQAAALGPLQAERDRQRSLLVNQLGTQLGPNGSTTTAGAEALNRFDTETANIMSTAQQQTLGQLLGVSQNAASTSYQGAGGNAGFNSILSNLGSVQSREVQAAIGTDNSSRAGAPFVGSAAMGSNIGTIANNVGGTATMLGALGTFGGKGTNGSLPSNIQGQIDSMPSASSFQMPSFGSTLSGTSGAGN